MKNYLRKKKGFYPEKIFLLLLLFFLGSGMAFSQGTITVTDAGDSGPNTLRQALIDAVDNDIIVFNGVTTIKVGDPLEMGDKTITIDGGGTVVLDGALTGTDADTFRVVNIMGVADKVVTLANLTIQNGYAKDTTGSYLYDGGSVGGGAVFAYNAAGGQTVLQNCIFQDNKSFARGGAVKSFGANLINNCQFLNNSAEDVEEGDGGGLYAHFTTITDCTFDGNTAVDRGGGLGVDTLSVLSNCTFTGNSAGDHGGGLYSNDTTVVISACIFDANTSTGRGGGLYINDGTATGCEITNNTSGDHGGGVWLNRGILLNSTISGNSTSPDEDGGGVGMTYWSVLANCTITGNHASDQGGGVFSRAGLIQNCIITGNTAADDGGGLFMDDYELTRTGASTYLVGCVVTNNSAVDNSGGIHLEAGAVVNSIVANNSCDDDAGGIEGRNGPWIIVNSVVYANTSGDSDANIRFTANAGAPISAAHSAFDAEGVDDMVALNMFTLNQSPFIGGSGADSLMLRDGSLLIDAGVTEYGVADVLPPVDLAGNPRLEGPLDIGPYEKVGGFVKVEVTGVTLDQSTLTLDIAATGTLVATIAPEYPTIDTVTWSSDNEAVATVADGVVTGVAGGTATITVTTTDGSFTANCIVTVNPAAVETASITFLVDDTSMGTATGFAIKGSWNTATGEYDAAWNNGDEHSDFFDDGTNGDVTAGDHIWTVTLELVPDGGANTWEWGVNDSEGNWIDGNFQFTVTDASDQTLDAFVILSDDASLSALSLNVGALDPAFDAGTTTYAAEVPEGTTSVTVSATANDANATISGDGAIDVSSGSGTATIVVTAEDGSTATYTINITVLVGVEQSLMDKIEIYPNPVSGGKLFIELGDAGIESLEIYNILGVTVFKENVIGRKLIEIETTEFLESGMYFVKVIKGQSIAINQFIVQ